MQQVVARKEAAGLQLTATCSGNTTPLRSARDAHRGSQFAPIHGDELAQNGN